MFLSKTMEVFMPERKTENVFTVNELCKSLKPGYLVLVAGRPSTGKTSFAVSLALDFAERNKGVFFHSLERAKSEIAFELFCSKAKISPDLLRAGKLPGSKDTLARLGKTATQLSDLPVYLSDKCGLTVAEICRGIREMKETKQISLAVIDYLQLVSGKDTKAKCRREEIEEILSSFKKQAKEIKTPIVITSHLRRFSDQPNDHRVPTLSDLSRSVIPEEICDVIVFASRKDKRRVPEYFVAKHRSGGIGRIQ
jgi:replicative DNA helicase